MAIKSHDNGNDSIMEGIAIASVVGAVIAVRWDGLIKHIHSLSNILNQHMIITSIAMLIPTKGKMTTDQKEQQHSQGPQVTRTTGWRQRGRRG